MSERVTVGPAVIGAADEDLDVVIAIAAVEPTAVDLVDSVGATSALERRGVISDKSMDRLDRGGCFKGIPPRDSLPNPGDPQAQKLQSLTLLLDVNRELETLTEMMQLDLQTAQQRYSEAFETLAQLQRSLHEIAVSMIQNMR